VVNQVAYLTLQECDTIPSYMKVINSSYHLSLLWL